MGGLVIRTQVGLDLHDPADPLAVLIGAHQARTEQAAGDGQGVVLEEGGQPAAGRPS